MLKAKNPALAQTGPKIAFSTTAIPRTLPDSPEDSPRLSRLHPLGQDYMYDND